MLSDPLAGIERVGKFSSGDLNGWEPEYFVGETLYRLTANESGVTVLCAESRGAASGLVRQIPVDLGKTPFLNWSWQVDTAFLRYDEKTKQGDDYPARVYVVLDDGLFFWQTKALNYVWAGRQPSGSLWISPYISDNVKLIAVESGNARKGLWRHEKRNVIDDLKLAFGKSITQIDAVAIMTDTDNTGGRAQACYGDIFFSAD
ncbi:MAG: DUF3047 domain-containing protein [Methylococcales bacterium]